MILRRRTTWLCYRWDRVEADASRAWYLSKAATLGSKAARFYGLTPSVGTKGGVKRDSKVGATASWIFLCCFLLVCCVLTHRSLSGCLEKMPRSAQGSCCSI